MAETRLIENWQNILQSLLTLSTALQRALQTSVVSSVERSLGKKIKSRGTFWEIMMAGEGCHFHFFPVREVNLAELVA